MTKPETKAKAPATKPPLNLYQKLIEVRKSATYVKKDAKNKFQNFTYTSSSAILSTVRAEMDAQGVLLIPKIKKFDVQSHKNQKGNHEFFTVLSMLYIWKNADAPDEQIKCPWMGQGLDTGEKGLGKALTYAEKFFMLKFFNISTDDLDPDAHDAKVANNTKLRKKPNNAGNAGNGNQNAGNAGNPGDAGADNQKPPAKTNVQKYNDLIARCVSKDKWNTAEKWLVGQKWATLKMKKDFAQKYMEWLQRDDSQDDAEINQSMDNQMNNGDYPPEYFNGNGGN